ncbi:DUF4209 domain-containing protein [Maridesulfovibrio sp.]|uniref:DUF4209 domain-containing protein n=1 Tax=Maridesulfovibrio sp. TaxID=2795000 RepID=UPI003BAA2885
MDTQRFLDDLELRSQDFDKNECEAILSKCQENNYAAMYRLFSEASSEALERGNKKLGKIYWLLSDACSMMLDSENRAEPFKPLISVGDRRSAIPEDFSQNEILFFADLVDEVGSYLLKARLADLAWLRLRKIEFALKAIDAYKLVPLTQEQWVRDGKECWNRMLDLILMLRAGAGDRLELVEQDIITALLSSTAEDGFLGVWLTNLLLDNRLGNSKYSDIVDHLQEISQVPYIAQQFHKIRSFFEAAVRCYECLDDKEGKHRLICMIAETWVNEADARKAGKSPSHLVAAGFYENAIHTLRMIPSVSRDLYNVDQRISEIHTLMTEAGSKVESEMTTFQGPSYNATDLARRAEEHVSGKEAIEALLCYANLSEWMSFSAISHIAIKQIEDNPLSSFFGLTHVSREGRVIARTPSSSIDTPLTVDDEIVFSTMMQQYGINVGVIVSGYLVPALRILHVEHLIKEADFISLAKQSPAVPPFREHFVAKGLNAGYNYDFATALHLLSPQLENIVRFHLKNAGAKTTTLNSQGIEHENGLSTLVELPEMSEVFGDDLAFEVKALFCSSLGANLRNEVAHGLLDHRLCNSQYGIYAWWLVFKLVLNPFWNKMHSIPQEK